MNAHFSQPGRGDHQRRSPVAIGDFRAGLPSENVHLLCKAYIPDVKVVEDTCR